MPDSPVIFSISASRSSNAGNAAMIPITWRPLRSHRPSHLRHPTASLKLVEAVLRLRETIPDGVRKPKEYVWGYCRG